MKLRVEFPQDVYVNVTAPGADEHKEYLLKIYDLLYQHRNVLNERLSRNSAGDNQEVLDDIETINEIVEVVVDAAARVDSLDL